MRPDYEYAAEDVMTEIASLRERIRQLEQAAGAETVVTEAWWGVRYTSSCGGHITSYGTESTAREEIARSSRLHCATEHALMRREITTITTPWEEVASEQ